MSVSAQQVKALREQSGAGMLDCKKALEAGNGDMEKAMDWLRTKGLAEATKKASRAATEGLVGLKISQKESSIVELNAETDFVARNDSFQNFLKDLVARNLIHQGDYGALLEEVKDSLAELVAKIGENISLRRAAYLHVEEGVIASYVHNSVAQGLGRIGVLVALESQADPAKLQELGHQLAMHIAAAHSLAVRREDLPAALVAAERAVQVAKAKEEGRAENVLEKIVEGRMRKFFEQVSLLEQTFVLDGETKLGDVLLKAEKEYGFPIAVKGFIRFALGEGLQKESSDFADEVNAALKG